MFANQNTTASQTLKR